MAASAVENQNLSSAQAKVMDIRISKNISYDNVHNILIRGTNWIGDVVMTLPALAAARKTFPKAKITVLVKPWVAAIFDLCPDVDEVFMFQSPGEHEGVAGKMKLARELRQKKFDMAILLQNAIEAAIIARWARIPIRIGYNSDARGWLLTHSVQRTKAIRRVHQIDYYVEMLKTAGFQSAGRDVHLRPNNDYHDLGDKLLDHFGLTDANVLCGIAPGAAYGPAKRWYPERYAAVAERLISQHNAQVLMMGSEGDRASLDAVQEFAKNNLVNLAGKTNLKEAIALIAKCRLFISNDSGLMHVAGALGIPTVAIFGSTNPTTTSPVGEKSVILYKDVPCSPCLKQECPTDFRCMDQISVEEVCEAARKLLDG
ncbi:MAG: lipopolysaccharide heptosyltransferase II [Deltaproteobacteria bacterium]|nr:lipopolysaccharide heptosyltransferase II [Deltaproteobacteria bacterium]